MLARKMAESIAARIDNPNGWNLEARRIAERLGLDVTRVPFHARLIDTCYELVIEAKKQCRTEEQIRAAFEPGG